MHGISTTLDVGSATLSFDAPLATRMSKRHDGRGLDQLAVLPTFIRAQLLARECQTTALISGET
jgi:hypothetical protein